MQLSLYFTKLTIYNNLDQLFPTYPSDNFCKRGHLNRFIGLPARLNCYYHSPPIFNSAVKLIT